MKINKALAEYSDIINGMKDGYTRENLTVEIIRLDHPELNFMDVEEITDLIKHANSNC